MILLIDNYDSFVHNLARYLRELGCHTRVIRNDAVTPADVIQGGYEAVVLSPGPCTPAEAGVCVPLLRSVPDSLPVLGVCLGHQAIVAAFGGRIGRTEPVHGRAAVVHHGGAELFHGIPTPFLAARYHSLAAAEPLPPTLHLDAWSDDGVVMAVSHTQRPVFGVQFHPESVLTEHGHRLLSNFLQIASALRSASAAASDRRVQSLAT